MNNKNKYILSIESTGKICSVALFSFNENANEKYELISEYSIFVGNKHDKFLAELCNRILTDNELTVNDLSAVAVSVGPGSFTGLRIGVALAKGLCFDYSENYNCDSEENCSISEKNNSIKLIAVPTLKALSFRVGEFLNFFNDSKFNFNKYFQVLSVIPSHSDLVYEQLFDANNNSLTEITFSKITEIKDKYSKNESLFLSTNGKIEVDFGIYLPEFSQITAATVGKLAIQMYRNNEFSEPDELVPLYVQDFVPR